MEIQVSELIVRFMERLGIRRIYGMPGAHILPVYDALIDSSIESVLAKHEQGAAFMAGGHSRATGEIGACIATAGPGATNLVTGIANAHVERQPLLAITGETSTHIFGRGGLQESSGEGGTIDQVALFQSITGYARRVERTDYLGNVLYQATRALQGDAPGPVLISLPCNLQKERVDAAILEALPLSFPQTTPCRDHQIDTLARMLLEAERPVVVAGHGCLRAAAQPQIQALAEHLAMPVATSLKAKGVIDESSPFALGSLGVTSGGGAARYLKEEADLILVLGASFNERTSYLWDSTLLARARVVQVDRDPRQLEKAFRAELTIAGDIARVLDQLLDRVRQQPPRSRQALPKIEPPSPGSTLFPTGLTHVEYFYQRLANHFASEIMVFDDNIIYAQNFYRVPAQHCYYPNTGISSLGYALPAAIGARFARPLPTFAILGDGGFQMCAMELMTAVNYGIPLNVVLFNNGTMGLIRKNQHQQYDDRFTDCDFINPDYALLAKAFGMTHLRVEDEQGIDQLFQSLDLEGGLNLIEVMVEKNAFPNYDSRR